MNLRWLSRLLLLVLMLFPLAGGCQRVQESSGPVQEQIAPEAPVSGGPTPSPTLLVPDPASSVSLPSLDDYFSNASSYRWQMVLQFDGLSDGGQTVSWQNQASFAYVASQPAWELSLLASGTGQGPAPASLSAFRLGDESYLLVPSVGCIGGASEDVSGVLQNPILPGQFLTGISSASLISEGEIVNGVTTQRFEFDETELAGWSDRDVALDGQLFLDVTAKRLVRVAMQIEGPNAYLSGYEPGSGTLRFQLDIFDVNQPLTVQPPSECLEAAPYPVLDDAVEITSIDNLLAYESRATFEQAVAFYQDQMPLAGWLETGEATIVGDSAALSYEKNGRIVIVSIDFVTEDQLVRVLISP